MKNQTKQLETPILKTRVEELVIGDQVLIENEFGEYLLQKVIAFSPKGKQIKIGDYVFNPVSGLEVATKWRRENKEVVIGRYFPEKRIHLGNGVLFTEQQRYSAYRTKYERRDRRSLIDQICRSTISDWTLFSNSELLEIVKKLNRLNHLELKVISVEKPSQNTLPNQSS